MLYVFGEWTLDTQRYELCHAGHVRRLRRKAFQVLTYLLAHADRVVTKQELCEQVWPQQFISDAALESTIKAVRQALGDSGRRQQLIKTVYGSGYRLIVPVAARPEPSPEDETTAPPREPPWGARRRTAAAHHHGVQPQGRTPTGQAPGPGRPLCRAPSLPGDVCSHHPAV